MKIGNDILSFTVWAVEQCVDFLLPIFRKIGVFFEKLSELIAFLFNFGDIIQCKKILKFTFNEALGMMERNSEKLRGIVNREVVSLKSKLGHFELNNSIMDAVGGKTLVVQNLMLKATGMDLLKRTTVRRD